MIRRRAGLALAGLALALGVAGGGWAQVSATVTVTMKDATFAVPRSYLTSSYLAEQPGPIDQRRLEIAFWLSDRRPPQPMPLGLMMKEFWPDEGGRGRTGASDFVVTVLARHWPERARGKWVTPAQMAAVAVDNTPWLGLATRSQDHGLDCRRFERPDFPGKAGFVMCTAGGEPELYLVHRWMEDRHEDYWRLDAWYPSDGLFFTAFFPAEALARWREVVEASATLLRAWRVKP
jgi:hypothetical protein